MPNPALVTEVRKYIVPNSTAANSNGSQILAAKMGADFAIWAAQNLYALVECPAPGIIKHDYTIFS